MLTRRTALGLLAVARPLSGWQSYWYQTEPYTDFPALPPVDQRVPRVRA